MQPRLCPRPFTFSPHPAVALFPSSRFSRLLPIVCAAALAGRALAAPIYSNDFEKDAVDKVPAETMVLSGDFQVKEEGGKKFLELPGSPLETFGLLFGPAQQGEATASARFFGTKQGRKFPAFGISLGGVSGYRLEMSGGKKALELFKGDESRGTVPFDWTSGAWTFLRIQIRKTATGCTVEGKAWTKGTPEPEKWNISLDEKTPPPAGRAAIWGTPYSGTPIRYDDLLLDAVR
jgi:hypothetical protein